MNKDQIRELLLEAYEAGWRGSLELKEDYVEAVMEELPEEKKKVPSLKNPYLRDANTFTISTSLLEQDGSSYTWEFGRGGEVTIERRDGEIVLNNNIDNIAEVANVSPPEQLEFDLGQAQIV